MSTLSATWCLIHVGAQLTGSGLWVWMLPAAGTIVAGDTRWEWVDGRRVAVAVPDGRAA